MIQEPEEARDAAVMPVPSGSSKPLDRERQTTTGGGRHDTRSPQVDSLAFAGKTGGGGTTADAAAFAPALREQEVQLLNEIAGQLAAVMRRLERIEIAMGADKGEG